MLHTFRVLVLAVVAAVLLCAGTWAHAGDGTAALRLLPRSTALVVTLNAERTRSSDTGRKLLRALLTSEDMVAASKVLRDQASVDLERDVATVVIAMADDFSESRDLAMVIEGRLSAPKVIAAAKSESSSFTSHTRRGVAYHVMDDDTALAFVGRRLIVATKGWMPAIIDAHRRKARSITHNRPLMKLVASSDTARDAWGVFLLPKQLRKEIERETGGHAVHGVAASVDTRQGLAVRVHADMSTPEAAKAVAGLLDLARPKLARSPKIVDLGLASAFKNMRVSRADERLEVELTASPDEVSSLEKRLEALD